MWKWLKVILETLRSSVRKQRELALENLALRQQLATLKYRSPRPNYLRFARSEPAGFWYMRSPNSGMIAIK